MNAACCPRCGEMTSLIDRLAPEAIVECPLCREQFEFREVLAQLPPPLKVVQPAWLDGVSDPQPEDADDLPQLAMTEDAARTGEGFDFEQSPTPRVETSRGAVRRRRSSSLAEVLKIILGGVAAIPIAQLVLWWLPGDLRRDPFDLGPQVAQYVPWVVPESLRGEMAGTLDGDGESDDTSAADGDTSANLQQGASEWLAGDNNDDVSDTSTDDEPPDDDDLDVLDDLDRPPFDIMTVAKLDGERPDGATLQSQIESLQDAFATWVALDTSDSAALQATGESLYRMCTQIASSVTRADMSDLELVRLVSTADNLLLLMSGQPRVATMLGQRGNQHWLAEQRDSSGILLRGEILGTELSGNWRKTRLRVTANSGREVTLVSWAAEDRELPAGTRALGWGVILPSPTEALTEYQGEESTVVLLAQPLLVEP